ncbi:GNAT family N-acetyltransferase [Sodalis sp. (in: enterobacteria)]|uniref:GNAT family N-acetyltransferase n=1 Tax=Sodalis sp. (in: enterobacteria) TaxID=1898979 RepID=UPI003F38B77B
MDILSQHPYAFLGSRLKRLAEQLQTDASLLAEQTGTYVTPGLFPILALLEGKSHLTVGELSRAINISQPAMTKSVAKLAEAGLVLIRKDDADKRQSLVALTDAGKTAVAQGQKVVWPLLDSLLRELIGDVPGSFIDHIEALEHRLAEQSLTERAARRRALDLRPAAEADVSAVVSLLNRAYRGHGAEAGWTTEAGLIDGERISEATLRQEIQDKPHATLLVWQPKDQIEGCVWLEPGAEDTWYLGSLAIAPQRQNQQFGRRLLAAAEGWILARGGRTVKMTIIEARDTLLDWYERRGYRRTGETEPFPVSDTRFGISTQPGLTFAVLTKSLVQ